MSAKAHDHDTTALFRRSWSLYDAITEQNCMAHREIYAEVRRLIPSTPRTQGTYRLLDLGCGNARFLAPILRDHPPAVYCGVDLSATALAEARQHLADLPSQITLLEQDLLVALEQDERTWEMVFTGFAVHHLSTADKARFFMAAAQRLAPHGWLIMIDVVREPHEDREAYLNRYVDFMQREWTGLAPGHLEEACAHVRAHDQPETLADLAALAQAAGLDRVEILAQHGTHHTLRFRRSTGA